MKRKRISTKVEYDHVIRQRIVRGRRSTRKSTPRSIPDTSVGIKELLQTPDITPISYTEINTPEWFRFTEKASISVIVPLYKSHLVISDLIKSWDLQDTLDIEIIFVDDACPTKSSNVILPLWEKRRHELKSKVGRIYVNQTNLGFGSTCNVGARQATGDYLIFLNADTIVIPGWIEPIIDLLKKDETGIVGNLQIKHGGVFHETIDSAGSEWQWIPPNFSHIGRHIYCGRNLPEPMKLSACSRDLLVPREREMVTGCCVGIRKQLFDQIGGFNQNYRVGYWEDAEMCLAVREKGYKVLFQPASKIYHKLSHSGAGDHAFQNHNKNYFMNKWVNSARIDPLVKAVRNVPKIRNILLQRNAARGDVLIVAGVAAALKKKYPEVKINFLTNLPDVLADNPYIDRVAVSFDDLEMPDVCYNLDLAYERRPFTNMLEAYADEVGVKVNNCELFIKQVKPNIDLSYDYIVIHAGRTTWIGRDWKKENFDEIASRLRNAGQAVVCIGSQTDSLVPCDMDLRGRTSIYETAWIIKNSKLFLGIDSFPMHIAQVVNKEAICFFGSIDPATRIINPKLKGITAPNLSCLGCHHRKQAPSICTNTCETGTLDCINLVTPDLMWEQILSTLKI